MNTIFLNRYSLNLIFINLVLLATPVFAEKALIAGEDTAVTINKNIIRSINRANAILVGKFEVSVVYPKNEKVDAYSLEMNFQVDRVVKGEVTEDQLRFIFFSDVLGRFDCNDLDSKKDLLNLQKQQIEFERDSYLEGKLWSGAYKNLVEGEQNEWLTKSINKMKTGNKYVLSSIIEVPYGSFDEWYRFNNMMIVEGEHYILFLNQDIETNGSEGKVMRQLELNRNEWYPDSYIEYIENEVLRKKG